MPKISKNNKLQLKGTKNLLSILAIAIVAILPLIIVVYYVRVYMTPEIEQNAIERYKQEGRQIYVVTLDILPGESLIGKTKKIGIPEYLYNSNILTDVNIDTYIAAQPMAPNSMLTKYNTYDPQMHDQVLETSRDLEIDFIDLYNINAGDYVDIRIKKIIDGDIYTYNDAIVNSKKHVKAVDLNTNKITLMFSEGELQNLNSATFEAAATEDESATIYATRYVNPATQKKAEITYTGAGFDLTKEEVEEARQKLAQRLKDNKNDTQDNVPIEDIPIDNDTNTDEEEINNEEQNQNEEEPLP